MRVFQEMSPYGAGLLFTSAEKAYKAVRKNLEDDIADYNRWGRADKARLLEKELEVFEERYKDYLDGDVAFGSDNYWVKEVEVY